MAIPYVYCIVQYVRIRKYKSIFAQNRSMLGSFVTSTHDVGTSKSKHKPTNASQSSSAPKDANVAASTRVNVGLEYASLRYHRHCPLGMYVVPSVESILVWDGVLFVHQGGYMAVFLVSLSHCDCKDITQTPF
jgi:hypothetical protein